MPVEGFPALDFHDFHRVELRRRAGEGHGAMAAAAARGHGSIAFRLPDGAAYTYTPSGDTVAIEPGDSAADTVVELTHDDWEGLVHDYESAPGLLYAGRVRCPRGEAMRFVAWEPALRALFTGRAVYDPARLELRDAAGRPLDVARCFDAADSDAEMSHFLRAAGYLFVRGVFGAHELEAFLGEARELAAEARPGDRLSWWARDGGGREVLCRVTRAAAKPRLARLPGDPRMLRLAGLAGVPLVHRPGEGNGVTLIFKNPGVREGLSDLPWHRDCGMGGHALMCPVLIVSVFLTPATAETGELRFLPGSWTRSCGFFEATDPRAPRGVAFEAAPGDVTVHFGDGMHAAPPPLRDDLDVYRTSAVVGFGPPHARVHRGRSYNDVLHRRDDGQIEHLARVARGAERREP